MSAATFKSGLTVQTEFKGGYELAPDHYTPVDMSFTGFYKTPLDTSIMASFFEVTHAITGTAKEVYSLNIFRLCNGKNVALTGFHIKEGDNCSYTPEAEKVRNLAEKINQMIEEAIEQRQLEPFPHSSEQLNESLFKLTNFRSYLVFRKALQEIFSNHCKLIQNTKELIKTVSPANQAKVAGLSEKIKRSFLKLSEDELDLHDLKIHLSYSLPLTPSAELFPLNSINWDLLSDDEFHRISEGIAEGIPHIYFEFMDRMQSRRISNKKNEEMFRKHTANALIKIWVSYPLIIPNIHGYLRNYCGLLELIASKTSREQYLKIGRVLEECKIILIITSASKDNVALSCGIAKGALNFIKSKITIFDELLKCADKKSHQECALLAKYALLVALMCLSDPIYSDLPATKEGIQRLLTVLSDLEPLTLMKRTLEAFIDWKKLFGGERPATTPEPRLSSTSRLPHTRSRSAPSAGFSLLVQQTGLLALEEESSSLSPTSKHRSTSAQDLKSKSSNPEIEIFNPENPPPSNSFIDTFLDSNKS